MFKGWGAIIVVCIAGLYYLCELLAVIYHCWQRNWKFKYFDEWYKIVNRLGSVGFFLVYIAVLLNDSVGCELDNCCRQTLLLIGGAGVNGLLVMLVLTTDFQQGLVAFSSLQTGRHNTSHQDKCKYGWYILLTCLIVITGVSLLVVIVWLSTSAYTIDIASVYIFGVCGAILFEFGAILSSFTIFCVIYNTGKQARQRNNSPNAYDGLTGCKGAMHIFLCVVLLLGGTCQIILVLNSNADELQFGEVNCQTMYILSTGIWCVMSFIMLCSMTLGCFGLKVFGFGRQTQQYYLKMKERKKNKITPRTASNNHHHQKTAPGRHTIRVSKSLF